MVMSIVIAACAVAVLAVLAVFYMPGAIRAAQQRRSRGRGLLAARLGLAFDPAPRKGRPEWSEVFNVFRRGWPDETRNHMAGVWRGLAVEAFDYTYSGMLKDSDGSKVARINYENRTIVVLEVAQDFPDFGLEPESNLRVPYGRVRRRDVTFEREAFDLAFYIECEDEVFSKALVDERLIDVLMRDRNVVVQMVGSRIVFHRETLLDAAGVEQLLQFAADFYAQVPDHVKKDYARG
ncbi:MAG: hypothetical protein JW889_08530 [Verrucomicrobia bacterium]|nr:hypothetical protein [Verrucomicrobiota bacterium]